MKQEKTKKSSIKAIQKYKKCSQKTTAGKHTFVLHNVRKKNKLTHRYLLIGAGALMGLLNGFFGGGGGMVCVPILQKCLNLDAKTSHATAIMVIFPLSIVSAFIYVFKGYLASIPLLTVGAGVLIGGLIGAFALKFLPPKAVRIIFAVIMFAGGIKLII